MALGFYNADFAREQGCTHRVRMHGVIPAFINLGSDTPLVVYRHDLLGDLDFYFIAPLLAFTAWMFQMDDAAFAVTIVEEL